jgi:hypothetical protein
MQHSVRQVGRTMTIRKIWLACVLLMLPLSAFAYVDPGSGMLIWQGLIAVVGGALVFVRNPIESVKRWIGRWKKK